MKRLTTLFLAFAVVALVSSSCHKAGMFNPSKKIASRTIESFTSTGEKWSEVTEIFKWDNDNLVEETLNDNGDVYVVNFSYDNQNRLTQIKVSDYYRYEYFYDKDKLIRIESYEDNSLSATYYMSYTNSDISRVAIKYANSGVQKTNKFIANPLFFMPKEIAKMITDKKFKSDSDEYDETYDFTYDKDGNVAKCIMNLQGGSDYIIDYEYDQMKNPFYGNYGDLYLNYELMYSPNNVVRSEATHGDNLDIINYEYTYSDKFPLTQICKNENGVVLEKTTYTYFE